LSAWLESHKRYPDSARQRGEEGRAVLRFAIDRGGRVLDFAVAQSTGHPDLDASLEEMMRGAVLPPFPAGMTQPRIDVSVTIRFSLALRCECPTASSMILPGTRKARSQRDHLPGKGDRCDRDANSIGTGRHR
jgi:TonB family protein